MVLFYLRGRELAQKYWKALYINSGQRVFKWLGTKIGCIIIGLHDIVDNLKD